MTEPIKPVRRIVCIDDNNQSKCISDAPSPDVRTDPARPGYASTRVWVTDRTPARLKNVRESLNAPHTIEPPAGGSICRIVDFPPSSLPWVHPAPRPIPPKRRIPICRKRAPSTSA